MTTPKLTIDTNCFINLFDGSSTTATSVETLSELISLGLSGRADIAITTRVESDLEQDTNPERKAEMRRLLRMMPVVGTVLRWDMSRWDSGDMWASEEDQGLATELQRLLSPGLSPEDKHYSNKVNDIDHLLGHFKNRRDIFITDDGGILRKHAALRDSFGIVVMRPADALQSIFDAEARKQRIDLTAKSTDARFISRPFKGRVTFDYSSNDGRFVIGDGQHLFETRWSKASDTSIHAYTDSESIQSLALAKGENSLESALAQAEQFDYTSRVRSPQLGAIVVWRNTNGYLAATQVIEIRGDTRGSAMDELVFEYLI
jgi:hypothetical protein